MNIDVELKKLTIINRMCHNYLRLHPHAYMDYGTPGDIINAYHNTRAMLMNRLEQGTDYKFVVQFVPETHEAVVLDRAEYLADFDRLYDMYEH